MLNAKVIYSIPDAPWVVFLHGFGGSSRTWQKQLSDYGARYNLLLFDLHDNSTLLSEERLTVEELCPKWINRRVPDAARGKAG